MHQKLTETADYRHDADVDAYILIHDKFRVRPDDEGRLAAAKSQQSM